ncbi:hypothetical protein UFOVP124_35 [uncultured Caudovirales phage]|uniref:Uncharacterized protein n=1 Tax=uncultured Caudovirales phage TaxID=2100421 RepID=A0A6J5L836_9CAUD|nr:hypothetical protein UFOVP124_35 [uncultured Caudovirales phage]
MSEHTSEEHEEAQRVSDALYQEGYDAAHADLDAELKHSKSVIMLATAHRMLARSLEMDDTRPTLAEIETAICRLVRKVAPDAK